MNRIILLLSSFAISVTVFSQGFYGVSAGFNYATIKGTNVAEGVTILQKPSFRIGFIAEVAAIGDKFCVQTGVEISGKGYEAKDANYENLVSLSYAEIPINLVGKLPLGSEGKSKFLFGAGTYLAFGIDFRTRLTTLNPLPGTDAVSINNGDFADYGARIFDLGLTALTGVQIGNKIQATVFYQPGLLTVFYGDDFGNVKNRVAGLRVSYNW